MFHQERKQVPVPSPCDPDTHADSGQSWGSTGARFCPRSQMPVIIVIIMCNNNNLDL